MRYPRRRRVLAGLAATLALALVGTACGTNVGGPALDEAVTIDTSRPFGGDPATEGTPVRGGTLTVGMYTESRSFDPTIGSNLMATAIYDSLLKFDEKGEPQPLLAEGMESPDGGTTWVLKLRPGVTFHDGTPLNADAVIFNVNRHRDDPTARGHLYTEPITNMVATDDLTVTFTLSRPVGSFSSAFALRFNSGNLGAIASPAAVQQYGEDYGRNPVGAGPFKFVEWVPNDRTIVERFDGYWDGDKPYLDRIEFRPLSDTESRYASVANGDIDLDIGGFFPELYRSSADPNLDTYYGPGGNGQYLYLNMVKAPFDDRRMREAVIRSIDPRALNATLFHNAGSLATTAFAEGDQYFSKAAADAYPTFDLEKAKQLVADYKASGGNPHFTYNTGNSPDDHTIAAFMQAAWTAAGMTVDVKFDDISTYIGPVIQGGQFGVATWIDGPYVNPYPFMQNLFHSGGIANYGKYANPQVDQLLEQAVSTTDPAERIEAYQKVQEQVNADLPVVWLARAAKAAIARPNVKGVSRYLDSELFFSGMWKAP